MRHYEYWLLQVSQGMCRYIFYVRFNYKTKLKVNYLYIISGEFHVIKCVISIVFLSNDKIFVTIVSFNICNTLEQPIQKSSTESGYTVNMVVN